MRLHIDAEVLQAADCVLPRDTVYRLVLWHVEAATNACLWPDSEGFFLGQDATSCMLHSSPSSRRHRCLQSLG